jgi:hypothetical protein
LTPALISACTHTHQHQNTKHRLTHVLQHACSKHTHAHGTNKHAQHMHDTHTDRHRHTPGHTPTLTRIYLPRLALVAGLIRVREVGQLGVEAKDCVHEILVGYSRLGQPSGIVGIVHGNGIHCPIPQKTLYFAADFIPQQSAELCVISHNYLLGKFILPTMPAFFKTCRPVSRLSRFSTSSHSLSRG